jgi:hypothetical protein
MKLESLKSSKFEAFKGSELQEITSVKGGDKTNGGQYTTKSIPTYVGANTDHYNGSDDGKSIDKNIYWW